MCTTGINDTGGKFAAGLNDTGGSFASVVDTDGKFARLGTPGGGPLPSRCNEDNKSGSVRVVYINCVTAR